MNFFWWVFGSLFIFLAVYYAFVAVDKQNTKRKLRYGATIRATESANGIPLQQQTVIYTIPTTRQLSQQYPQMVTTYPPQSQQGQNNPPPYMMDKPPSYDQAVFDPDTTTTANSHTRPTSTSVGNTTTAAV